MLFDVWIITTASSWDAIAPKEDDAEQIWHYTYRSAITGFWKSAGSREVYNVIGSQEQVQDLLTALEAAEAGSVSATYAWIQGPALDSLDYWPTDPTEVLALMKDHVIYNEDGSIDTTTPATIENPNWGHIFLGQGERIFAGEFDESFGEEFF